MKTSACLWILGVISSGAAVGADEPEPPSQDLLKAVRATCESDIQKFCPTVQPGGGRIAACLKEHKSEVSDGCKQAVMKLVRSQQSK